MTRVAPDVEYEPTEPGEDPFPQVPAPDVPEEQQAQIQVHRLAFPLPDKRGITVLNALIDAYLTLRSEGMFVNQLHSDLGGEFTGAYIASGAGKDASSQQQPQGYPLKLTAEQKGPYKQ